MTVKVILDSNFLLLPSQFRIDIFAELLNLINQRLEAVLLSVTYEELRKMAETGSSKMRQHALLGLKLAEKCRIVNVERDSKETNDDVIIRVAKQWSCPVATNDQTLRRRLRNINVPVIYLRQKSRLELEGNI